MTFHTSPLPNMNSTILVSSIIKFKFHCSMVLSVCQLTHSNRVCLAFSTGVPQCIHTLVDSFLLFWRYLPKHPCPVNVWVRWLFIRPYAHPYQPSRSFNSFIVQRLVLAVSNRAFHLCIVVLRILIIASRTLFPGCLRRLNSSHLSREHRSAREVFEITLTASRYT